MTHAYSPVKVTTYPIDTFDWCDIAELDPSHQYQYQVSVRVISKVYGKATTYDEYALLTINNIKLVLGDNYKSIIPFIPVNSFGTHIIFFYCDTRDWTFDARFTDAGQDLLRRVFTIDCIVYPLQSYDSPLYDDDHAIIS